MSVHNATSGTIAEYDMVMSISENAINKQFESLYNKTIEGGPLPPPPGLQEAGIAPPKASRYYINHDLNIHDQIEVEPGQYEADYSVGLFGHIKCPKVSFSRERNKAFISIQFQRDESVADPTGRDSVFKYWIGHGPHAKIAPLRKINGYTLSWEVNVSRKNIQNIMTELVNPANDKNHPSSLSQETVDALTPFVNKNFTVSAIFCLFEATQMTNSLKMVDENGELVSEEYGYQLLFKVQKYYLGLQQGMKKSQSTPYHPFVLGYGLSQDLPSLNDVQSNIDPKGTPKFFLPKEYIITTTPGKLEEGGGTLNFCILTHREPTDGAKRDKVRTDPTTNLYAGFLEKTLLHTTHSFDQDGILAIGRDLVFDRFFCPKLSDAYFIDPEQLFLKAMNDGSAEKLKRDPKSSSLNLESKPPTYLTKQEAAFRGKVNRTIIDDDQTVNGFSQFNLSWTSDLQQNPNVSDKDARREVTVTFTNHIKQDYEFTKNYLVFDTKQKVYMDAKFTYVLNITPGKGGTLDIVKDDVKSITPKDTSVKRGARPAHEHGLYCITDPDVDLIKEDAKKVVDGVYKELVEMPIVGKVASLIPKGFMDGLKGFIDAVVPGSKTTQNTEDAEKAFKESWKASLSSISNKIILPAGNVFNFRGVDIDEQGNLYAQISFSRGTDGVKRW